jgi:hypothetical protein
MFFSEEHKGKLSEAAKRRKGSISSTFGSHLSEEHKTKLSELRKGEKNPNWKRHYSEEERRKLSESRTGKKRKPLSNEWKRSISKGLTGKKKAPFSEKAKRNMSISHKGSKSHFWKGGITPITTLIRQSQKYQQWRTVCFIRDKFTCRNCEKKGKGLEVHHKKPFYKFLVEIKKYLPLFGLYEGAMLYDPLWDTDNGVTLCKRCHKRGK